MRRPENSLGFDATISGRGVIKVPVAVREALGADAAGPLRVQLTPVTIANGLRRNGVTEMEIERIAAMQLEPREQVIRFLLSEGTLRARRPRRRKRT